MLLYNKAKPYFVFYYFFFFTSDQIYLILCSLYQFVQDFGPELNTSDVDHWSRESDSQPSNVCLCLNNGSSLHCLHGGILLCYALYSSLIRISNTCLGFTWYNMGKKISGIAHHCPADIHHLFLHSSGSAKTKGGKRLFNSKDHITNPRSLWSTWCTASSLHQWKNLGNSY